MDFTSFSIAVRTDATIPAELRNGPLLMVLVVIEAYLADAHTRVSDFWGWAKRGGPLMQISDDVITKIEGYATQYSVPIV